MDTFFRMIKIRSQIMIFDFLNNNYLNRNRIWNTVLIFLFMLSFSLFSQSSDTPYDFPVKPGTSEWAKFQGHEEMISGCQIPEDFLKKMSTKALLKICLQYPLFGDVIGCENLQFRFEQMASNFNGLKELFHRPDVAEVALQEYINMSNLGSSEPEAINEKWRCVYLEILLSQPSIITNLPIMKQKRLLREAVKKYSAKFNQPGIYGSLSLTSSCLVMARLLNGHVKSGKNKLDKKISNFDKIAFSTDPETMSAIVGVAENYLNN
jgi:hypothetical protein